MLRAVRMLRGPADVGARLTWALVTASLADQLAVAADAGLLTPAFAAALLIVGAAASGAGRAVVRLCRGAAGPAARAARAALPYVVWIAALARGLLHPGAATILLLDAALVDLARRAPLDAPSWTDPAPPVEMIGPLVAIGVTISRVAAGEDIAGPLIPGLGILAAAAVAAARIPAPRRRRRSGREGEERR